MSKRTPPRNQATTPSRRAVLFGGAAALGTGLVGVPGPAAHAAGGATGAATTGAAAPVTAPPYAFYWFPDRVPAGTPPAGVVWRSLLHWDPDTDPDLPFNTGTVPLANRVAPRPVHAGARSDQARVQSLAAFGTTSQNPSQGSPTAATYAPTFWTYVEELVFWGGSSGEGLVLAPTAPVTDAAHRAGVPVLGNIFLPPVAFGGDLAWTRDLVQQDSSGRYPVADKLVLAARRLGFDGWFVNAETDGGDPVLAGAVQGFLQQLQEAKDLRTTWYDAMIETGRVDWQGELDDANDAFFQQGAARRSDAVFLDFGWTPASLQRSDVHARQLGRSRYELYAGVDVQARGTATPVDWEALFPPGQPARSSLGLYRPDWTFASLGTAATLEDFHARERAFWVGPHEGSADAGPGQAWPGVAARVAERTSITSLPFTSAFGTGHGRRYVVDGVVVSERGWSHLGLQDVQPQRQWTRPGVRRDAVDLHPRLDFDAAYQAGDCLAMDVTTATGEVGLFLLDVPVGPHAVVDLVHDGGPGGRAGAGGVELEVLVRTTSAGAPGAAGSWECLEVDPCGRTPSGWVRSRARLSPVAGRRLQEVGVRLRGARPRRWRLGQLTVADGPGAVAPAPVTGLRVQARGTAAGPGRSSRWLRLLWDRPAGTHHVELYARHRGERWYLGATPSGAFYAADVAHPTTGAPPEVIEAVAVSVQYVRSAPSFLRLR